MGLICPVYTVVLGNQPPVAHMGRNLLQSGDRAAEDSSGLMVFD